MLKSSMAFLMLGLLSALCFPTATQALPTQPDTLPPTEIRDLLDQPKLETIELPKPIDASELVSVKPFSAEARYMSIAGAYRYLTFERTGLWLSREEAVAQVQSEIESATR